MINNQYKESLDWLISQQDVMKNLVLEWSNINSASDNISGINKLQDLITKEFSKISDITKGIHFKPYECIDKYGNKVLKQTGKGIAFLKRPRIKKNRIFFCIHSDTVHSSTGDFQIAREKNSKIITGPGVADAKSGIVILLFVLRTFELSQISPKPGWEVFISPDEEIGSVSSRQYLKKASRRNSYGFLFEPTLPGGIMAAERKGSGFFQVFFYGKSAHAGRDFHKGKSAVYELARFIVELEKYTCDPSHAGIVINAGNICVERPVNVVPDFASLEFNVRVENRRQMDEVTKFLKSLVKKYNSQQNLSVKLSGEFHAPPKEINPEIQFLMNIVNESALELNMPLKWEKTGGACDGNKLLGWGLPNIDTMGAVGYNIHSDKEYMETQSLVPRARLALLSLFKLCEKLK